MRTVVVTGGNTGIGFETAAALASRGFNTIIACRNLEKGKSAIDRLKDRVPNGTISAKRLDLADFSSIHQFADDLVSKNTSVDVLINNAGVMGSPEMKTKDGLELQIGTNHFGHFLLTSLLYPLMQKHKDQARIVNLSSSMHRYGGSINFEDINLEKSYDTWTAYGRSKLANVLFTNELARRIPKEDNVTVNTVHPGIVHTELQRYVVGEKPNFLLRPLIALSNSLIKTAAQGAATSVYVATDLQLADVTGKYFKDCKETNSHPRSHNVDAAKRLWDVSNTLTGAKWKF